MDSVRFRAATTADASFLAPLVAESSGGVWPALQRFEAKIKRHGPVPERAAESSGGVWPAVWKALADDNEPVEAYGARYLADAANDLSVRNTVIAETDGTAVGALISYQERPAAVARPESGEQSLLPDELTRALQPYRELRDADSLYIAEVCVLPQARGNGLGSKFMKHAMGKAADAGLPRVSLRVFSANAGAVRLYERLGFTIVDERPVISHPDIQFAGSVYLMSCALRSGDAAT